jgi:uncharacterized membrane protein
MSTPNQTWNFIREIYKRLVAKSPKFFQVIQWLSTAALIVSGLPGIFEELGITLPQELAVFQSKVVAWAAVVALVISKLTVADPSGLPFTEKK